MKIKSINFHFAVFFAALVFFDQISKYLIRSQGGFFYCNKGIAFGWRLPNPLFFGFWLIIIIYFSYLFFNQDIGKRRILRWSIVAIFAGATGNLIDRLMFGCVLDFIRIGFWPAFNFADSFVVLGIVIFGIVYNKRLLKN